MPSRDGMHSVHYEYSIAPISVADNTAQVSRIHNTQGYGSVTFILATGVVGDAAAQFTVLLEESDDSAMAGATTVADYDMLPQGTGQLAATSFTEANDNVVRRLGYIGTKQYLRLTITPANNATAALITVLCAMGYPISQPTAI